jgi:hypothetical protein
MANSKTDYIVNILGNAEGLARARREATGQFQKLRESGRRTFAGITRNIFDVRFALSGLAGALSFAAIANGAQRVTRELEEVRRTARSLGEDAQSIQELNFVFREFGLESNDVSDALNTLADRSQDAKDGMQSFVDDFRLVGIEVEDLRGKRPAELFELFVDRLSKVEDPTRRNAAAVRIFGDDLGRRLLPFLIDGAEGFDRLRQKAHEAGAVLGDEAIDDAADAADAFRELRNVFDAAFTRAIAENAGQFEDLADTINSPRVRDGISGLVSGLSSIAGWLVNIVSFAGQAGTALGEAFGEFIHGSTDSIERLDKQIAKVERRLRLLRSDSEAAARMGFSQEDEDELTDQLRQLYQQRLQLAQEGSRAAQRRIDGGGGVETPDPPERPDLSLPDTSGGGSAENREQSIARIIEKLREQAATTGEAAQATELYKLEQLGASESTMRLARELLAEVDAKQAAQEAEEERAEAAEKAAEAQRERTNEIAEMRAANRDLIADMQREIELQQMTERERVQAIAVSKLSVEATDQQREAVRRLAGELYDMRDATDDASEFFVQAARNMESALADFLFDPFEEGLEGMFQSFARTLQRMAAEAAAAQILEGITGGGQGGGGGLVGAGVDFVSGLFAGTGHTGAVIGQATSGKTVSPLAWAGAPRLHTGGRLGLAPGEVPFIGLKGERVLSREQTREYERGMGPVQVTVPISTPDAESFRRHRSEVEASIGAAVSRALQRNR